MGVDTKLKRASAVHVGLPWRGLFPIESDAEVAYDYMLDETLALDNLYGVYSTKAVASPAGGGSLIRLRRGSDNAESDFEADLAGDGWVSAAEITTWLAGATGYVCCLYDQSGNGREATQAVAMAQPKVNVGGTHPTIEFVPANRNRLEIKNSVSFASGITVASLVAVRAHATTSGAEQRVLDCNRTGDSGDERMLLLNDASTGKHRAVGRRDNSDARDGPAGFDENTDWAVQVGRFDFANAELQHDLDAETETDATFHDAGATGTGVGWAVIGGNATGGSSAFSGELTMAVLISDLLSDVETAALIAAAADLKL
jgi:hypothetical protein